jgi:hypothetical protein
MSARSVQISHHRSFVRYAVAGVAVAAFALAGAQPAHADPVGDGIIGSHTAASCGWFPQTEGLLSLWDDKIVRVNLPSVSGVTADQLVWAHVRFLQPDSSGSRTDYRTGWFYTFASPGQMSTTWTSYQEGTPSWTYVQDAPGESGYAAGDTQNPVTSVYVTMYWMTGSTVTGSVSELATNAANAGYPYTCNGGGTLF